MSLLRHMTRRLTRFLAVTIVMIVAGFSASAAQAHQGHPHRQETRQETRHEAQAPATASAAAVSAKAAAVPRAEASAPEACGLCCPTCMACCHSGLMPAASVTLPLSRRPVRIAATQAAIPPGLAPEALPRPPRPLA